MITTVLGTCDVCDKPNVEVAPVTAFGIETYACDECRDQHGLRLAPEPMTNSPQVANWLSALTLAFFIGAILLVAP